jgi:CHAT domain-containing protein
MYETLGEKEQIIRLNLIISTAYLNFFELFKSFEYIEKAKSAARLIENKEFLIASLSYESTLFFVLGNKTKSVEISKSLIAELLLIPEYASNIDSPSLTPYEKLIRKTMEYNRLRQVVDGFNTIDEKQKAIEFYEKALILAQSFNRKSSLDSVLSAIGGTYYDLKNWEKALEYYQKALIVSQENGNKDSEADNLSSVALTLLELNKPNKALKRLYEAQLICVSIGKDDFVASNKLPRTWYAPGNRRLGIFNGKKLLNWILTQKEKLKDFDRETQQLFVSSFDKPIRRLADWLIEEGQFAEAERVLRLLKEEEHSNFVRRDAKEIASLNQRVTLDENEQKVLDKCKLLADKVSEIGQEFYRLEQKEKQLVEKGLKLNDEDEKRYQKLGEDLKVARDAFQLFLDKELVKEIGETRKKNVADRQADRQILGELSKGTVTLYTVVGENRMRVILTTPTVQVDGKYEIKAEDLNKKVFAFRDAQKNPKIDPRPLGKELYDILLKPIEKDLKASNAKTLLWYLDGPLRYIPLAALSPDGNKYLVEEYQNVILTSKTNKTQKVLGLDVSLAETADNPILGKIPFPELPDTKLELFTIVSDETTKNETGILTGKRFLDGVLPMKTSKTLCVKENTTSSILPAIFISEAKTRLHFYC